MKEQEGREEAREERERERWGIIRGKWKLRSRGR